MKCKSCKDTGWLKYDDNHSAVCYKCCPHDNGWWELTEGYMNYIKGKDNRCCLRGCGTMARDLDKK